MRLPDAVFDLKPALYDPDNLEYLKELILETDEGDRVQVISEGRARSIQIKLQILELNGRSDFDDCTIHVSQPRNDIVLKAGRGAQVQFDIGDPKQPVTIGIFR